MITRPFCLACSLISLLSLLLNQANKTDDHHRKYKVYKSAAVFAYNRDDIYCVIKQLWLHPEHRPRRRRHH